MPYTVHIHKWWVKSPEKIHIRVAFPGDYVSFEAFIFQGRLQGVVVDWEDMEGRGSLPKLVVLAGTCQKMGRFWRWENQNPKMIKKYAKKMGWNLQFFYGSKLKTWGTTLFSLFFSNWGTQFWPIPLWGYVIGKNGRIFSMDILDEM